MLKVSEKAPDFNCTAVVNQKEEMISLAGLANGYKIIFFYPADFTFVCPTELHAFQERLEEFKKRGVTVIGVSTDTIESHKKWLNTPKKEGGVEGITYPLIADSCTSMAKAYGVLDEKENLALRGTFLLDQENIVQMASIYNMPLGRNIDELLRVIDAVQFTKAHGQVCPANWTSGQKAMDPTREGVKNYFS